MTNKEQRWEQNLVRVYEKLFPKRIIMDLIRLPKNSQISYPFPSQFIWGGVHTGKTIYACQLLTEFMKQNYLSGNPQATGGFISVPELLMNIRNSYDHQPGELRERELIDHWSGIDCLVMDDLGVEKNSEWTLQTLYIILNRRYEQMKITLITSNLNLNQLNEKLQDDRMPSRIQRMGKIVNMKKSYQK